MKTEIAPKKKQCHCIFMCYTYVSAKMSIHTCLSIHSVSLYGMHALCVLCLLWIIHKPVYNFHGNYTAPKKSFLKTVDKNGFQML